jgi:hypothetical protein
MRRGQSLGALRPELQSVLLGQRTLGEFLVQGRTGDELHYQVVHPVLTVKIVDGGDGDVALQALVMRPEYDPHATRPDLLHYAVMAQDLAD